VKDFDLDGIRKDVHHQDQLMANVRSGTCLRSDATLNPVT